MGERYDPSTGLQYLNARYYDVRLGMFIQPDWVEVTEPGVGTNRYGYAGNDPINFADPYGNSFWNDLSQSLQDTGQAISDFFSGNVTSIDNGGTGSGSYGYAHVNGTTYGCFGCGGTGERGAASVLSGYASSTGSSIVFSSMDGATARFPPLGGVRLPPVAQLLRKALPLAVLLQAIENAKAGPKDHWFHYTSLQNVYTIDLTRQIVQSRGRVYLTPLKMNPQVASERLWIDHRWRDPSAAAGLVYISADQSFSNMLVPDPSNLGVGYYYPGTVNERRGLVDFVYSGPNTIR